MIWVGGAQRTGTSLMVRLLCSDPKTHPPLREVAYLRMLVSPYAWGIKNYETDMYDFFESREAFKAFHGELVRQFVSRVQHKVGEGQALVMKEPHLTPFFPALAEWFPESAFVLMVRDPRDTILSMIEVGERHAQAGKPHVFSERNMERMCAHFLSFYGPWLAYLEEHPEWEKRTSWIRYEDLVGQMDTILPLLRHATGLGLEIDPDKLSQASSNEAAGGGAFNRLSPWRTVLSGGPVSNSSVGRYKDGLTSQECTAIEQHCAVFMGRFGYAATQKTPGYTMNAWGGWA